MSKNSTVDILQPLPFEKWSLIKKKTEHNWPHFAYYYYWIENAIVWKKGIQIYLFKFIVHMEMMNRELSLG